jgi:hypothetical protein
MVLFAENADPGENTFDDDRLNKRGRLAHACHSGVFVRSSGKWMWMP